MLYAMETLKIKEYVEPLILEVDQLTIIAEQYLLNNQIT